MTLNVETHKGKSTTQANESANSQIKKAASGRLLFSTITQSFLNQVEKNPNRPSFFYKDSGKYLSLTWKEFYDHCRELALGLHSLGLKQNDKVCILSSTRLEWALSDMATLGNKAVTVPIYPSNTEEDCQYIINHCEAKILFVEDEKQLEKIRSIRAKLPNVKNIVVFSPTVNATLANEPDVLSLNALRTLGKRDSKNLEHWFEENLKSATKEDIFTICYTSGTTGQPKGVVLNFDSLASLAEDVEQTIGAYVSDKDIMLSFLPFSHIFGKVESMMTYHFGWQVYYAESIEKLFVNIGEVQPTLLFAVPRVFEKAYARIKAAGDDGSAMKRQIFKWAVDIGQQYYQQIWQHKQPSIAVSLQFKLAQKLVLNKVYQKFGGRIRYCIAGGAPLPMEIAQFMQIVGITILEGYGLTETCAPVTLNTPHSLKFGSIGKPLPEVSMKIAQDGELLVKSRKVFKEYFKDPQSTEASIQSGWLHTGDIGIIDDEGFVKITDRKKDLIVTSGGKNVAPQKIENLMKNNKFLSQIVVLGDKRNYLSALVVLEKEEVIKFARENNILFSNYEELVKNVRIQALVQAMFTNTNQHLASYESVKRFHILPNDFTVETGELTPSLKVKRKFVTQKFKSIIDQMYGTEEAH